MPKFLHNNETDHVHVKKPIEAVGHGSIGVFPKRKATQLAKRHGGKLYKALTPGYKVKIEEEVAANSMGGGNIAKFDPLLGVAQERKRKRMSDLLKRWMWGR